MKLREHVALAAKFEAIADRFRQSNKTPDWLLGIWRQFDALQVAVVKSVLKDIANPDQSTKIQNLDRRKALIFAVIKAKRGYNENKILEYVNASLAKKRLNPIGLRQLQRYLKAFDERQ